MHRPKHRYRLIFASSTACGFLLTNKLAYTCLAKCGSVDYTALGCISLESFSVYIVAHEAKGAVEAVKESFFL